jgi:uncharacterized membrane protein
MRFIGRLLWLIITVITVIFGMVFATSNNLAITLTLWPFETLLTMQVWLLVLSVFGAGVLIGGTFVWLSTLAIRARNWRLQKNVKKLEKKASAAEAAKANIKDNTDNDTNKVPVLLD